MIEDSFHIIWPSKLNILIPSNKNLLYEYQIILHFMLFPVFLRLLSIY
jgi:hypothetical protein